MRLLYRGVLGVGIYREWGYIERVGIYREWGYRESGDIERVGI
jgi:hypothetical protein